MFVSVECILRGHHCVCRMFFFLGFQILSSVFPAAAKFSQFRFADRPVVYNLVLVRIEHAQCTLSGFL